MEENLATSEVKEPIQESPVKAIASSNNKVVVIVLLLLGLFLCGCGVLGILLFGASYNTNKDNFQCVYNGISYKNGESFPAMDGCNTCTCDEGTMVCTEMACNVQDCIDSDSQCMYQVDGTVCTFGIWCDENGQMCGGSGCEDVSEGVCMDEVCVISDDSMQDQTKSCVYDGITYKNGESFPAIDGCNTCSCDQGAMACTLMACNVEDEILDRQR